ncbi:alpha/beta hydrolase family protein [Pseudonocardia saturnea]
MPAAIEPDPFTVDGVDAWIVRPEGEHLPVLLSIHGGPMTQYATAWFDEFQMWAAAGYAVVYYNPHGSTGDTEAFSREIRAPEAPVHPGSGWAGRAAQDVLAVLDAALARHPELDATRIGVLGGSYGGYLTTWLVANTDRFAAACSERAANNLESLEWDSDAAGLFQAEIGVSHLDAPEVDRAQSPVHQVRDIHTPLLIIHSEGDLRCPPSQADQLFVALRLLGREVEYWRFPEKGHDLSRSGSPRHRIQRAELILDFFGRHLGGRRPEISWAG